MKEIGFVKVKCRCGHLNIIAAEKPWTVEEPIYCENCGRIIVAKEKSLLKKWGDKVAALFRVISGQGQLETQAPD